MSWLDEIKEKVAEASELADEDDTATLLWSSAELGSYVPKLIAYIDKLHEALVLFETDECLNDGSFQCIYEAGNSHICGECIRKWAEEAVK